MTTHELARVGASIDDAWRALLAQLAEHDLAKPLTYRNLAGDPFTTPLGEIVTHVLLHGQYHRGKANAAEARFREYCVGQNRTCPCSPTDLPTSDGDTRIRRSGLSS